MQLQRAGLRIESHILELPDRETWLGSSIGQKPGLTVFALDFACGGDDNVILKLVGNRIAEINARKEANTAAAIGQFIRDLHKWDTTRSIKYDGYR